MRGHAPIVAMRLRRAVVHSVTLNDYPTQTWVWRDWPLASARADVEVEPSDNPLTLDLRYLVGVKLVTVESYDEARLQALVAAATKAGAQRVIGVHLQRPANEYRDPTVLAITDTHGVAAWPN